MIWLIRYLRNSVWENRLQDIRYWKEDICMPVLNEEYDVVVVGQDMQDVRQLLQVQDLV